MPLILHKMHTNVTHTVTFPCCYHLLSYFFLPYISLFPCSLLDKKRTGGDWNSKKVNRSNGKRVKWYLMGKGTFHFIWLWQLYFFLMLPPFLSSTILFHWLNWLFSLSIEFFVPYSLEQELATWKKDPWCPHNHNNQCCYSLFPQENLQLIVK